MLPLKYLLVILGIVLFGSSGALVAYDIYLSSQLRRLLGRRRCQDEATRAPARQELSADVDRALRPVRWGFAQPLRAVNSRQFQSTLRTAGTRFATPTRPGQATAPRHRGGKLPSGRDWPPRPAEAEALTQ
jgi:hypothetical protein